jgi:hypothetical protein
MGQRRDRIFGSSSGENPGTNRFEIVGTLGKLVLENNQLRFHPKRGGP